MDGTRDALRAYREGKRASKWLRALYPDGVPANVLEARAGKLGAELPECRNLTDDARRKGREAAAWARTARAQEAYRHLVPTMQQLRRDGLTFQAIADRLNEIGHQTVNGAPWNRGQVKRMLDRAAAG